MEKLNVQLNNILLQVLIHKQQKLVTNISKNRKTKIKQFNKIILAG